MQWRWDAAKERGHLGSLATNGWQWASWVSTTRAGRTLVLLTILPSRLQLRILIRAMKLLKPAGRIVYSTCSLNPVENEAVVAAALRAAPGMQELHQHISRLCISSTPASYSRLRARRRVFPATLSDPQAWCRNVVAGRG